MDINFERRALELFDQSVGLQGDERLAWLTDACGQDSALLARVLELHEVDNATGGLKTSHSSVRQWSPPEKIGSFRILERIGQGGMGVVYRGERVSGGFEQQVAIKVLQAPLQADAKEAFVRRFEGERDILASLNHANIAGLIDGGSFADGTPYFVMELVEGVSISEYSKGKPLADVMAVFVSICAAVQSAHQRLIVHRDIKPSNVLVTEAGEPKLLDFGIAKALDDGRYRSQDTVNYPALTPQYASPEQITGAPITTASDVYSLGALLYELVTGSLPYDVTSVSPAELAQTVVNTQPLPFPTAVRERLPADLELIVLKALHKDPDRRYPSASALAADLANLAGHRPVTARPDSFMYRASRFVRRNRAVTILAAVTIVSIVAGASLVAAYSIEANRESARLQATTEFFQDLLLAPGGYRLGKLRLNSDVPMSDVVRQAGQRAPGAFTDDPETLVAMLSSVAVTLFGLGDHTAAEQVASDALEISQRQLTQSSQAKLQAIFAYLLTTDSDREPGEAKRLRALVGEYGVLAVKLRGKDSREFAVSQILEAQFVDDPAAALATLADSHKRYLRHGGSASDVEMGWRWQAEANARFGIDPASAIAPAKKALAIFTRPDGTVEMLGGQMLQILGLAATVQKDWPVALGHFKAALQVYENLGAILGQLGPLMALGKVKTQTGDYDDAATYFERTRQLLELSKTGNNNAQAIQLTALEIGLAQRRGQLEVAVERGLAQLEISKNWEGEVSRLMFLKGQTAAALYRVGRNREARLLAEDSKAEIQALFQGERRAQLVGELERMLAGAQRAYLENNR